MRENGFYWVQYEGRWIVAEWSYYDVWLLTDNYIDSCNDEDLEAIDERRIVRDEQSTIAPTEQ